MVVHPTRKSQKRLREVLNQLFGYLDQSKPTRDNEVIPYLLINILFRQIFLLDIRHSRSSYSARLLSLCLLQARS